MKSFKTLAVAMALAGTLLGVGCTKQVVRDANVYQAELAQYDQWATKQASLLRDFVTEHCVCEDGKFTTERCSTSADYILTIEARAAWHRQMSLYLAGLTDERPEEAPPAIAENSTLCPPAPEPQPVP